MVMNRWARLLQTKVKPLILGMIHVKALPGSPLHKTKMAEIVSAAVTEAEVYQKHHVDGIIVENMHDRPYLLDKGMGPETMCAMTVICNELRGRLPTTPMGVQILSGCNREALAVALATDFDFIRAEGFIYSHIADEGLMNSCAGELLRYRLSSIFGCSSHAITSDLSVEQVARDAEFFLSDGVILTGTSTGISADVEQLKCVKDSISLPVLIGSGVTAKNLSLYSSADALIIGSFFKKEGKWYNEIDEERVASVVAARNRL
ncbi:hypothetical protein EB796_004787 [Bugula neritina]|uniref:Uncharacterized protein n=1 Tax=Bugula neritina TaxID=10212 RepID=A0A7J7KE46_BUGNE|nr:hypothetical protein EB796_004787 [Bugula neritina]